MLECGEENNIWASVIDSFFYMLEERMKKICILFVMTIAMMIPSVCFADEEVYCDSCGETISGQSYVVDMGDESWTVDKQCYLYICDEQGIEPDVEFSCIDIIQMAGLSVENYYYDVACDDGSYESNLIESYNDVGNSDKAQMLCVECGKQVYKSAPGVYVDSVAQYCAVCNAPMCPDCYEVSNKCLKCNPCKKCGKARATHQGYCLGCYLESVKDAHDKAAEKMKKEEEESRKKNQEFIDSMIIE